MVKRGYATVNAGDMQGAIEYMSRPFSRVSHTGAKILEVRCDDDVLKVASTRSGITRTIEVPALCSLSLAFEVETSILVGLFDAFDSGDVVQLNACGGGGFIETDEHGLKLTVHKLLTKKKVTVTVWPETKKE